ncbi:hypothetical protein GCM10023320_11870 [Pseudonocardia adelaidensis]|uniref:Uncharacterized protein n=1 Tax=Pseudonocardia adelaidensis TaxID=648754 RepID=A0ABP9NCG2_9PSEU
MQDGEQGQGDGTFEVELVTSAFEDRRGPPHIRLEEGRHALRSAGQQRSRMTQDDRVVVRVDDPSGGADRLHDLVHVGLGGDS